MSMVEVLDTTISTAPTTSDSRIASTVTRVLFWAVNTLRTRVARVPSPASGRAAVRAACGARAAVCAASAGSGASAGSRASAGSGASAGSRASAGSGASAGCGVSAGSGTGGSCSGVDVLISLRPPSWWRSRRRYRRR